MILTRAGAGRVASFRVVVHPMDPVGLASPIRLKSMVQAQRDRSDDTSTRRVKRPGRRPP